MNREIQQKIYGEFTTQEELDAEYNVEKAVPNFLGYIKVFQNDSIKIRKGLKDRAVVAYGPTLMERLIIYPSVNKQAPVLLFVYGGYWKSGIGDDYDFIAEVPNKAGFTVVIVTYALAPHVSLQEMVRQLRSSIAWTWHNIKKYNGNPERISVAGHSAGGHLVAMAMSTDWSTYGIPSDIIKGFLAIRGLYDIESVAQTFVQPAIRITAEQILYTSPIRLIVPGKIRLIVAWGVMETASFRMQSEVYLKEWNKSGNKGQELIIPQANHFNILEQFTSKGIFTKAILSLIDN